jgi:fluoroquinolone transport system permease protein
MNRVGILVAGDWQRFRKYHLLIANLVQLLIWILIASALSKEQLKPFIPFIFLLDANMLNIALVGTMIFYEKQEHTLNAILVSPVTEDEYLCSKVIMSILSSLLTLVLIALAMWLVKGITFTYWSLVPAIIVVAGFHALLGIALTYGAKDFTGIMLRAVLYMFVFWLPAVFGLFGLLSASVLNYLLVFPPVSSARLLSSSVTPIALWQIVFGYLYLALLSVVIYLRVVKPGLHHYVVREMGV